MTNTEELLAELAELEGCKEEVEEELDLSYLEDPTQDFISEISEEVMAKSDEQDHKVIELSDLILEEFDRAIGALTTVREAVKVLREELYPSE